MPNVLIVDDETIFRKGLRHMLSNLSEEWIIVGEAKDGIDALEQAEQLQPDIVITDISMPRMDGIELQNVLKERFPYTKCIVMSGYSDFDYVRNSFLLGAKDYLLKPVAKDDLICALNKLKQKLEEEKHIRSQHSNANIRIKNQLYLYKPKNNNMLIEMSDSVEPIEHIMNYVRECYAEHITLSMMAKKVYLNPAYLSTLFKNRTGISFVEFVTQIRIEEAKKQLQGSQKKISAIADDIGFINLRHFNRVFKSKTGYTPQTYRTQIR